MSILRWIGGFVVFLVAWFIIQNWRLFNQHTISSSCNFIVDVIFGRNKSK